MSSPLPMRRPPPRVDVPAEAVSPAGAPVAEDTSVQPNRVAPSARSEALRQEQNGRTPEQPLAQPTPTHSAEGSESAEARSAEGEASRPSASPTGEGELSAEDKQEVERLKARDAEVRAHEQAHAAAGGSHAGTPSYDYETGPDGKRYAVGGSVSIDTSEVSGDAEASIQKLQQVIRAANAPAQPSGQDRKVAANAAAKIAKLQQQQRAEAKEQAEATQAPSETDALASADGVEGAAQSGLSAGRSARALAAYSPPPPPSGGNVDLSACANCGSAHAP